MRAFGVAAGICPMLGLMLGGCAASTLSDRPATLRYFLHQATTTETEQGVLTRYHGQFPQPEGTTQRTFRDSIIWKVVAADDDDFNAFVRRIRTDRATMNLSTDSGVLFLNGLAAVTGTAGEKAALAVLSGGLLGVNGAFDKELFNLETMSALLARMRAARLAALVPIKAGLAQDADRYPLEQALVDLRAYANAGSLLATIDAITTDAGQATVDATASIEEITRDTVYRDSRPVVEGLRDRLSKLTDPQALRIMFAMAPHLGERSAVVQADLADQNRSGTRFRDGAVARAYLIFWLEQETGAQAELGQWSAALDLAERG